MSNKIGVYTAGKLHPWVEVVRLEDHLADIAELEKEVYSLKEELDKLMSSLEQWDEVFK